MFPPHILQQAADHAGRARKLSAHRTRSSRAKESSAASGKTAQPVCLTDLADAPELAKLRDSSFGTARSWSRRLLYGKQNMGVLALANGPMGAPFTQSDFVVFKSIAEQSAFALYNAIIYSEANEKKRLDHDLRDCARHSAHPAARRSARRSTDSRSAGINIPARQVSGDYFDYIKVDDERLGVAIADVSGKGVPASLIMAICRSVLRSQAPGILRRPMCCKRSTGSFIPTSRRTCSSAWPT